MVSPMAGAPWIDLWKVKLEDGAAPDSDAARLSMLDATEMRRWERMIPDQVRQDFLASHAALRTILADYLNVQPAEVLFAAEPCWGCGGPHGRPTLRDSPQLFFSLSHARGAAVVAVAQERVGVDLERLSARANILEIVPLLHRDEQRSLALIRESVDRADAALACWVRKEAVLKAIGCGIVLGADVLSVGVGPPNARHNSQGSYTSDAGRVLNWRSVSWPNGSYAIGLATAGSAPSVLRTRELRIENLSGSLTGMNSDMVHQSE